MAESNDKSVLMLPKLKENKVKRGEQGKWNRQPAGAFGDVARSINVVVTADVANVNSIPSMWAYPLALQSILPKSDYNDRVRNPLVAKWRGMLAAIALAPDLESFGKLTAQVIDLTDKKHENNRFVKSLGRLVPTTESLLFDLPRNVNPWLKNYVFRWNDRPVGMTSPSTIVCPAKDGDWSGLPWYENGRLESPEQYLTNDQKLRLSRWLVNLREQVTSLSMGISEEIAKLINDFIDVLGGSKTQRLDPDKDLITDEAYFGVPLDIGIYEALNRPLGNPRGTVFLSDLYFLKLPNACPNAELPDSIKNLTAYNEPISIILPLSPEVFQRPDAEAIVRSLEAEKIKSGTVLKLTLRIDGHSLDKEYDIKPENGLRGLPVAEIWPNFVHPNWKIYYGYSYLDIDNEKLRLEFPRTDNLHRNTHSFDRSKVSKFTSFPNHVTWYYGDKLIGTIPLAVPSEVNGNNQYTVGVDFGTSFTNVYKKQGNRVEKFSFDNLHYSITSSDDISRSNALTEFFIPPDQQLPMASILTTKGGRQPVSRESNQEPEIIFDGRIYSFTALKMFSDETYGEDFLIGNLKWNNIDNREPMRLFIHQLALQISAQALKNGASTINWSLSYPTAFSNRDKNGYASIWEVTLQELSNNTGLSYPNTQHTEINNLLRSESLAAAYYFCFEKNCQLLNAACIDIGGGTSDISIWEEHNGGFVPVYQFSVQLAGKHLFSKVIKLAPDFVQHIRLGDAEDSKILSELQRSELFDSALDALIKGKGNNWLKDRRRQLQDNQRLYGYLQILAIGIAGLHYYIGLVLQVLYREIGGTRIYHSGETLDLYFGGHGSQLLHWLSDTGRFESDEIVDILKEMVVRGSKFSHRGETTLVSTQPKEEAAFGLILQQQDALNNEQNVTAHLIAGEPCQIGDKIFNWDSSIRLDQGKVNNIPQIRVVTKPEELINLPNFLYHFHESLASKDVLIPAIQGYKLNTPSAKDNLDLWNRVVRKLRNSLTLRAGTTTESIRIEPPFILGLKALIEVLAEDWATRK